LFYDTQHFNRRAPKGESKMPKDALLFTDNYDAAQLEVAGRGGHVSHKFTEAAFVASLPNEVDPASLKNASLQPPPNLDADSRLMAGAWNAGQAESLQRRDSETEGLSWDTPGYQAPRAALDVIDPATLSPDISPKDLDEALAHARFALSLVATHDSIQSNVHCSISAIYLLYHESRLHSTNKDHRRRTTHRDHRIYCLTRKARNA